MDVVMLIEGEEEAGSRGFAPAVRRHKVGSASSVEFFSVLARGLKVGVEVPVLVLM